MPEINERAAFEIAARVKEEHESAVPKSKRTQFVEQAIAAALLQEAKRKALVALDDAPCADTDGRESTAVRADIRRARPADLTAHDRH